MHDPAASNSAQLPTEHFNTRFSHENLVFWMPVLIECAQIETGRRVLDIGCGTGGLSRNRGYGSGNRYRSRPLGAIHRVRVIEFARNAPAPQRGAVEWKVGSAEALPIADSSFDRVLLSLVLHQLQNPKIGTAEAFRSLAAEGRVVVRTAVPEDVAGRVPHRFFPSMSAVDADRMPPLDEIEGWLRDAGFIITERRRVLQNKKLDLIDQQRKLLVELHGRYSLILEKEREAGLCLMRAEGRRKRKLDRPAANILHSCPENSAVPMTGFVPPSLL